MIMIMIWYKRIWYDYNDYIIRRLANNKPILNKGGVLAIGFNPLKWDDWQQAQGLQGLRG